MYKTLILSALIALTTAATISVGPGSNKVVETSASTTTEKSVVEIVKSVHEHRPDGSFNFAYEGSDGSYREEVGVVVNPGTDKEAIEVTGRYGYIDVNGQLVEVKYSSGQDGFLPVGSNIPDDIVMASQAGADAARKQREEAQDSKQ